MIYTTKRCPHCHAVYEALSPRNQKLYGCSQLTCEHCGLSFITKSIIEPAILKVSKTAPKKIDLEILFYIIFGSLIIYAGAFAINYVAAFAFIFGGIFFFGGVYIFINGYLNYDKNYKQWEESYTESLERLKDPQYVEALQAAGFRVPSQFLDRDKQ